VNLMDRAVSNSFAARLFKPGSAQALALLRAAWPLAVGPDVARRTQVVTLEGVTLRLRVPDARWRKVLHRMQDEILMRLRVVAGDLAPRRLGFMEGPVAMPDEVAPEPPRQLPPPPPSVVAAAESIPDPELRARFLASAARALGRQR